MQKETIIQTDKALQTQEVIETELLVEQDAAPDAKPTLWSKAGALVKRLPRMQDPNQRKAGGNIVRFLALMLLLTLIARGTAGATLAVVSLAKFSKQEIIVAVDGSASVIAGGRHSIALPEGLTIKKITVTPGQKIQEGDVVAQLDPTELKDKLAREAARLKELQQQLKALQSSTTHDSSAVGNAERALNRAQQDYNTQKAAGEKAVRDAEAALNAAKTAAQAATDAYNALIANSAVTPEEIEEAKKAMDAANQAAATAQTTLDTAKSTAASQLLAAQRAVEDAKSALESAKIADQNSKKTSAEAAQKAAAEAETVKLDIEKQNKLITTLRALEEAGSALVADKAGIVLEIAAAGVKSTGAMVVAIADTSGGYEAELLLSKTVAQKLSPGGEAEVVASTSGAYYAETVKATILSIGQADSSDQIKVTLRLPEGEWKMGQSVQVRMIQSRQSYDTCIPIAALRKDNTGYFVLVVQQQTGILGVENRLVRMPVTLKAKDATNAAIDAALTSQDQVVTSSTKPVTSGDKVRVQS